MEKYLGENAVSKYAYDNGYSQRDEKIMNKEEFLETLILGLTYLVQFRMN